MSRAKHPRTPEMDRHARRNGLVKHCSCCGEVKCQSEFYYSEASRRDHRQPHCKACENGRRAAIRAGAPKLEERHGVYCPKCYGMSWRVRGPRCSCGLTYAEQEAVDATPWRESPLAEAEVWA